MPKPIHIALGETDFLTLVSGDVFVTVKGEQEVKIILSDIGFDRMHAAINEAVAIQAARRAHPR